METPEIVIKLLKVGPLKFVIYFRKGFSCILSSTFLFQRVRPKIKVRDWSTLAKGNRVLSNDRKRF